ncbi:RNA polymerase sigma factor SigJ [Streptomyces sp. NPDC102274]|uniref:RNA polymerase sigma factor SigJ n=1 Tax=Streptomyces sp. NPDC102274 TaxID=3366151 RepID=UPI0037F8851D
MNINSGPEHNASLGAAAHERRILLNVAFRMLGSSYDAEDVVQDTYVRWYSLSEAEQGEIRSPIAWLVRVASRICLDRLASARVRRERYIGEWLPEPIPSWGWHSASSWSQADDPADMITLDESVTMGVLVVLESVTPAERVAFVLHDVFGFPFREIAETVGRTTEACRQLAASARRRIRIAQAPRGSIGQHRSVMFAFKDACESGDTDSLVKLLDPDAAVHADGGGKVRTALRPVVGADKIARLFLGVMRKEPRMSFSVADVNGRPGLVGRLDGVTFAVIAPEVRDGFISHLWLMMNPEKLHAWRERDSV